MSEQIQRSGFKYVVLEFLRETYAIEESYDAYLAFSQFKAFIAARGYSMSAVGAKLQEAGLGESEWNDIVVRMDYLTDPLRVPTLEAYGAIRDGDTV